VLSQWRDNKQEDKRTTVSNCVQAQAQAQLCGTGSNSKQLT